MIEIEEKHNKKEIYYIYSHITDNKKIVMKKVYFRNVKIKDQSNIIFFLLYDGNENINRQVFQYVNYYLSNKSYHAKELASNALKLLFSFTELFSLDYRQIKLEDAYKLKLFLYGELQQQGYVKFSLKTQRNSDTINTYINIYRNFYEYLGLLDSPFCEKKITKTFGNKSVINSTMYNEKYILIDKSSKDNRKVPRYIRINEMEKIVKVIKEKYTLREEIIVRLMFECGLWIGEVLGLTLEDLSTIPIIINEHDDLEVCEIIIRNRLSDAPYQLAKHALLQ